MVGPSWVSDEVCELLLCHDRSVCLSLWKRTMLGLLAPVEPMRNYFGEHVTYYFAWTNFFTRWLLVPGAVGFLMWMWRPRGMTVEDSPYGLHVACAWCAVAEHAECTAASAGSCRSSPCSWCCGACCSYAIGSASRRRWHACGKRWTGRSERCRIPTFTATCG